MVKISFFFDNPSHQYQSGDIINLEAHVQVNSATKCRSIYARIYGYAHVEWTESRRVERNDRSHTEYTTEYTTYSSHETLFKSYQTLVGDRSGSEMRLAVGSHVYRASFKLPMCLPESHESCYGHIRYEAKVNMDVTWGFDNKERLTFYIIPRFDLNEFPLLQEPVRVAAGKSFGFCCCESNPLHIYNILPCSGFVPGDNIQYSLEMNNRSNVTINRVTVKLVERIVYHAYCPWHDTRVEDRTLWRHEFSINNRQNKVYSTNIHFNPGWNFHFFIGCGIITVEYYIKSKARTSGCHTNLSNCTRIIIGTVPFRNFDPSSAPSNIPTLPAEPVNLIRKQSSNCTIL